MANRKKRWPENIGGRYFVDDQCIDCDACRSEAPDHFTRNDEHGYSYVKKQPQTPEEIARCQAALEACPVEAIGSDGEENDEKTDENENHDGSTQEKPKTSNK